MVLSKTEILFTLIVFYTLLSITMMFIGSSINIESPTLSTYDNVILPFDNIITGFSSLPVWINTLLFTPLLLLLTWIIVSSLPTINGGS